MVVELIWSEKVQCHTVPHCTMLCLCCWCQLWIPTQVGCAAGDWGVGILISNSIESCMAQAMSIRSQWGVHPCNKSVQVNCEPTMISLMCLSHFESFESVIWKASRSEAMQSHGLPGLIRKWGSSAGYPSFANRPHHFGLPTKILST